MSKSISGTIKNFVVAIIVGLLLVSLAIWGVSDAFTSRTKDAVAVVGKQKISMRDFDTFFKRRLREENQKATERMTTQQAYNRGLHRDVVSLMVTRELIQIDADSLGLDVNRADALEFVESLGVYNNEITGKFDEAKLRQILSGRNDFTSRKQFDQDIKDELRQEQSLASLTGGVVAPQDYANQQYNFMTEQRQAKLLLIDPSAITPPADPSDEDLQAYIDENPTAFIAPEYRRFTLLRMEIDDILPDVEASEEEIKKQFDYKIKTKLLGSVETRSLVSIIAGDKETAENVSTAIMGGKSVDVVVAEFGLEEPTSYADILINGTTDPNTGEAAYTMEDKEAKAVEGSFGSWYSVYVTGITPAIIPDLESERATLVSEIKTNKAQEIIYNVQEKIQDGLSSGYTIEEAAKEFGVGAASYDFISRLGQTESGQAMAGSSQLRGVSQDDIILAEVFTSETGFEGDMFDTDNDGIAALRVDEIKASKTRPFEQVKEQALINWSQEKTDEALGALMTELAEKAQAGDSFEDLAAGYQQGVQVIETPMIRAIRVDGISGQLAVRLFEARVGQTVRGRAADGLSRIVGQIVSITPNTGPVIDSLADNLKQQTADSIDQDIQTAYRAAILKENPATTVDANIIRILGLGDQ